MKHPGPDGPRPRVGIGRLRMRTVLVVAMLVPIIGIGAIATSVVGDRLAARDAAGDLASAADRVERLVDVRDALADEEIHSWVAALASDLGTSLADVGLDPATERQALDAARARVDAALASSQGAPVRGAAEALPSLRRRVDAGTARYADVSDVFLAIVARSDADVAVQLDRIERIADRRPLEADVRSRLRAVREMATMFASSGVQVRQGLGLLLGSQDPRAVAALIDATTRFDAAAERAVPSMGDGAAAAWRTFTDDPAAQRTRQLVAAAAGRGLGVEANTSPIGPGALVDAVGDGARWALLLNDAVSASARDLEQIASRERAEAASATVTAVAAFVALAALSLGLVVLMARALVRPARRLEDAARRVAAGDFDLPPVEASGPREVVATVAAFNDMAATLAAVERQATALATDPEATALLDELPGRTGMALQVALDRLRASMRLAEVQRAELAVLATRDGLTGLLNRDAAFDAVGRELAQAARHHEPLMALFVDLDGLKEINDNHGHAAGDEALRLVAAALADTTRDADVVARIGGDEFLVVGPLPESGRDGAGAVADRILTAVRSQRIEIGGRLVPIRCSIGIAVSGQDHDTVERLVQAADGALYEAKRAGRDRVGWDGAAPQMT